MTSLDRETGRDRYFAAKERELDELLDPDTGMLSERFARWIPCPLCGAAEHERLFLKRGYTIVMVEQNFHFAAPLADRFLIVGHGQVVQQFCRSELSARMPQLR